LAPSIPIPIAALTWTGEFDELPGIELLRVRDQLGQLEPALVERRAHRWRLRGLAGVFSAFLSSAFGGFGFSDSLLIPGTVPWIVPVISRSRYS